MRKKTLSITTAMLLSLSLMLSACGQGESNEAPASGETTTEAVISEEADSLSEEDIENPIIYTNCMPSPTDYVSEEGFASADAWGSCDDRALASVMQKALRREKVTIALIGGSITQGTISNGASDNEVSPKKSYGEIFFSWWSETFPDTEFEFINAGIGATDSYLGVHRVGKDVLDYNPDLVLVEFSVNDDGSNNCKTTYDNLVRRILLSDSHPAVMLLFMGQTNGSNAQNQHVLIGFNYSLPMISYANYLSYALDNGIYSEKDLSGDVTHPSALGHAITGELLWKYLNQIFSVLATYEEPDAFTADAVTKDIYLDSEILDSNTLTVTDLGTFEPSSVSNVFPNDYTCKEGDGGITFQVECSRLGVIFYRTTDGKSGQFEVYVDGELCTSLNGDFSGGWGSYAESKSVYSGDFGTHVIEFRKAEESTGDEFSILGLLVAR